MTDKKRKELVGAVYEADQAKYEALYEAAQAKYEALYEADQAKYEALMAWNEACHAVREYNAKAS